jgi:hypothetical protein
MGRDFQLILQNNKSPSPLAGEGSGEGEKFVMDS